MTKLEASKILIQMYSVYCQYYPANSRYEEAISKAIMALERNKDNGE